MLSGRETLSPTDRRGLLGADLLWLQTARPEYDGQNGMHIHQISSLISNVRTCVGYDNAWTRAHISKIELLVLAWRRGGYAEYSKIYEIIYPRVRR